MDRYLLGWLIFTQIDHFERNIRLYRFFCKSVYLIALLRKSFKLGGWIVISKNPTKIEAHFSPKFKNFMQTQFSQIS
jgi:hypothetical protein